MKKIIFALLFAACFVSVSFAQTDQITLTTYYPAPFGMYQEMRVMGKLGVGTTDPTDAVEIVGGTSVTPEVVSIKILAEAKPCSSLILRQKPLQRILA